MFNERLIKKEYFIDIIQIVTLVSMRFLHFGHLHNGLASSHSKHTQ